MNDPIYLAASVVRWVDGRGFDFLNHDSDGLFLTNRTGVRSRGYGQKILHDVLSRALNKLEEKPKQVIRWSGESTRLFGPESIKKPRSLIKEIRADFADENEDSAYKEFFAEIPIKLEKLLDGFGSVDQQISHIIEILNGKIQNPDDRARIDEALQNRFANRNYFIEYDNSLDVVIEIDRYNCFDSKLDRNVTLFFFLHRRAKKGFKLDGDSISQSCHQCLKRLESLSNLIEEEFQQAPWFLRKLPEQAIPGTVLENREGWFDEGNTILPHTLDVLMSSTDIGSHFLPVHGTITRIRALLSLEELALRRWHFFLTLKMSGNDATPGWMLDRGTFPNDITFNTLLPGIPQILQHFFHQQGRDNKDDTVLLDSDRRRDHLAYCMLRPLYYSRGEVTYYTKSRDGSVRLERLSELFASEQTKEIVEQVDGGYWLYEQIVCAKDTSALQKNVSNLEDQPVANTLSRTWGGVSAMYVFGPSRYSNNDEVVTQHELPRPTKEYDNTLPRENYIYPIRAFENQEVGFGLLVLPAESMLLEGNKESPRPLSERRQFRSDLLPRLSFSHDIVLPELKWLSDNLFVLSTTLMKSSMASFQELIFDQFHTFLDNKKFLSSLYHVIYAGLEPSEKKPYEEGRSSMAWPGNVGLAWRVEQDQQEALREIELAKKHFTTEVLGDYIREFGHSFAKHLIAPISIWTMPPPPASRPFESDALERVEFFQQYFDPLLRRFREYKAAKVVSFATLAQLRMTSAQTALALLSSERDNFITSSMFDMLEHGSSFSTKKLFRYFNSLPGQRQLKSSINQNVENRSDEIDKFLRMEGEYWKRLKLLAPSNTWDSVLFSNVLPGTVETVLDTLLNNAFKHGAGIAVNHDPHSDESREAHENLRIHVVITRTNSNDKTIAGISVWDNSIRGIKGDVLPSHMITSSGGVDPESWGPLPRTIYQSGVQQGGEGQGMRILARALESQKKFIESLQQTFDSTDSILHLYLVGADIIENPARLEDANKPELAALRVVLEDLKIQIDKHNRKDHGSSLQAQDGKTASSDSPFRIKLPYDHDAKQGAFVLVQSRPNAEESDHRSMPVPERVQVMIVDESPQSDDLKLFANVQLASPKKFAELNRKIEQGQAPELILMHSSMDSANTEREAYAKITGSLRKLGEMNGSARPFVVFYSNDAVFRDTVQSLYSPLRALTHETMKDLLGKHISTSSNKLNSRSFYQELASTSTLDVGKIVATASYIQATNNDEKNLEKRFCVMNYQNHFMSLYDEYRHLAAMIRYSDSEYPLPPQLFWSIQLTILQTVLSGTSQDEKSSVLPLEELLGTARYILGSVFEEPVDGEAKIHIGGAQ